MNSNGDIGAWGQVGADAVPVDEKWVARLSSLNRKGRLAYYASMRRGESEETALMAAEAAHMGGDR